MKVSFVSINYTENITYVQGCKKIGTARTPVLRKVLVQYEGSGKNVDFGKN